MRKSALLLPIMLSAGAYADSPALKPGLWEMKQIRQVLDGQGMDSGGSMRICISPAMAARNQPMVDPSGRCEPAACRAQHDGCATARPGLTLYRRRSSTAFPARCRANWPSTRRARR